MKIKSKTLKLFSQISNDTLKTVDPITGKLRFSNTSLTKFTAWLTVLFMVFFMLYTEGFRYDVFVTMCITAGVIETTKSISKKIHK